MPIEVNPNDFLKFCETLFHNFGINYAAQGTADNFKLQSFYKKAVERNWTARKFFDNVDKFKERCKFPTFTESDFFNSEFDVKLFTHAEYEKLLHECTSEAAKDELNNSRLSFLLVDPITGEFKSFWQYKKDISDSDVKQLTELSNKNKCNLRLERGF